MTTRTLLMSACAAVGAVLMLGAISGCEDSKPQSSLLVNPEAARLTEKMPTTLDNDPVPSDTAVAADSAQYDAVCIEEATPTGDDAAVGVTPAPCAKIEFHEKFPVYSKKYTGTHIKTRVNYSNYDVGGGRIMRHVKIWPFESTYTWL